MEKKKPIPKDFKSIKRSRNLRNNATKEENHLWYDFLRSYPVRFHRQYVIEHYIADFLCTKAKLIIELDGSQHYESKAIAYDSQRTAVFQKYGFEVLRYTNLEIKLRFREVCEDIHNHVVEIIGFDPYRDK